MMVRSGTAGWEKGGTKLSILALGNPGEEWVEKRE
jgi:hypothetical protein